MRKLTMKSIDKIEVHMNGRHVGTLAETRHRAAFQYSDQWLEEGYSISPYSLPLEKRLYIPDYQPFEGVFGVFSDTLPDGWGRLVVDRYIRSKPNINIDEIDSFHRLMLVSDSGMGALTYEPSINTEDLALKGDYDTIAAECKALLEEDPTVDLDALFKYGGSSGGERPKILTDIDGESWIIKFPAAYDDKDIGLQEYRYSLCARECGINMAETRLFPSKICAGYFGTKRFDRIGNPQEQTKVHTVSAAGLLESSHRLPNLDYIQLMKLTMLLTSDMQEVNKMYELMCFNVFAHNRDDHSKNFSFLYDDKQQRWKLSPAYDLTYSSSQGGEHATTIAGEGKNPGIEHILKVARLSGLDARYAKRRAVEIEEIVKAMLNKHM